MTLVWLRIYPSGRPYRNRRASSWLLMTLVWLRIYPTYEVLGWLFDLEKSNAWENVQDVLAVLATLADFPFERPAANRPKLATPAAVFAALPEVKIVIDGKEQPFRHPQGWDKQKPFYSRKKKRHTVKNQIICTPDGRIGGVSDTAPGSTHDLTLKHGDGALDRLDEGSRRWRTRPTPEERRAAPVRRWWCRRRRHGAAR